jgi:hypothetical protein
VSTVVIECIDDEVCPSDQHVACHAITLVPYLPFIPVDDSQEWAPLRVKPAFCLSLDQLICD